MITVQQAVTLATAELLPQWQSPGTFYVSGETAHEDATAYLMEYGAREYLVDGDEEFHYVSDSLVLIDKNSGQVRVVSFMEDMPRFSAMTSVPSTLGAKLTGR